MLAHGRHHYYIMPLASIYRLESINIYIQFTITLKVLFKLLAYFPIFQASFQILGFLRGFTHAHESFANASQGNGGTETLKSQPDPTVDGPSAGLDCFD